MIARRTDIQQGQGLRIHLVPGFHFHDHLVRVVGRVDGRDLPGAVGGVEGVFNLLGGDAQRRGPVPVDLHVDFRALVLDVAGHILQVRQDLQAGLQKGGVIEQFLGVGALQGELIEAFGQGPADPDRGGFCRKTRIPGTVDSRARRD